MPPHDLYAEHLEILTRRTAAALTETGFAGVVIFSGASRLAFLDDQPHSFRVNPHFAAWVALSDAQECFLCFEPGEPPVLVYYQPEDYWLASAPPPAGLAEAGFDVRVVATREQARAALPAQRARFAYIGEPFEELASLGVDVVNPPALLQRLHHARARKTRYEIACMREASRAAARGHRAAERAFRDGASEFEIQLAFLGGCGQREQELPYPAIVALDAHAATLHYQNLDRERPGPVRSLLIDAGAQSCGYASDVTRTYAAGHDDFAHLIARMEEAQQSLCAAVHAGVDWRDVHLGAHRLIAEVLRDADIITIDPGEAVDEGLSGVFFPHGLGHLLGLQVHDVGGFIGEADGPQIPPPEGHPHLRLTRVLEEGFVVTMEPGIYFIEALLREARAGRHDTSINWQRVEQLRARGGIRIEDDLVVTPGGHENLTRDAFAALGPAAS